MSTAISLFFFSNLIGVRLPLGFDANCENEQVLL